MKFLRYNSRHQLFFSREGFGFPTLNPMGSSSRSSKGKPTYRFYEPLWLFRLRQRLFAFAGRQRCGRRGGSIMLNDDKPDTWDLGPDGNRTCSYCGSMHPDDFMELCRKVPSDDRYAVEGTDKSYKVYVKQPGVHNASQGAIKFYMHHAPQNPTEEHQGLFSDAARVTTQRWREKYGHG